MTLKQSIQIFARIRPTKKTVAAYSVDHNEKTGASLDFVIPRDVTDGFVNNRRESYRFRFQKVFDQAVKQEEIFEHIARPVADSVLAGYNGTIFAYGQTGSGKTFTITGGAERYSDRGIIPRTLSYLFNRFSQESSMVYTTHISYLEIYNEMGYDLLDPRHEASRLEDLPRVLILEDPDQNIHLRNLSLQLSANEEEALNLLFLGDTNRMIAETPMNQASTRSHCIFTVHVCRREPGSATVRRSKLHLVDLAGSDRVSKTGLNGQLLTEAKFINRSLHYLEQVILALSEKNRSHIPYRNSMLTSVLRDSLGGNCTTTMIATMAVDRKNVDESISTCRFAQRVALIKNEAVLNEELDPTLLIARLKREVQMLKEELELLQGEQREEQLTEEQIHRLEESVQSFLSDPDPDVVLSPGADMRKIHFCFSMMKTLILDERRRTGSEHGVGPESSDGRQNSAEVTALKKMLTQRDNEISILLQMLKKEKSRAQEAAALFTHAYDDHSPTPHNSTPHTSTPPKTARHSPVPQITVPHSPTPQVTDPHSPAPDTAGPQILPSQNTSKTPTLPLLHTQMDKNPTTTTSAAADLEGASGQDLSTARRPSLRKEEAFEMFVKEHESRETTEDNKNLLKQRASEARGLEQRLKESRDAINELKKRLALHRRQRAAHGVAESPSEGGDEVDLLEENLCAHIDREKKAYKSTFGHLRALRIEIEHLQLLLGRARTRLNRDFQKWWSQHTSSAQTEEGVNFVSAVREGPGELQEVPRVPPDEAELEVAVGRPTGTDRRTLPPSPPGSPLLSPGRPGPDCPPPPDVRTVTGGETVRAPLEESQNGGSTTETGWRALPSCPTSPPLTGDQQADAHILSFIKARQRLLSRTGVRR